MSKAVFEDIMAGLDEVADIIAGTADTSAHRVHTPVDVKAIRKRLGLSQERFAQEFQLSVGAVRDWEQGRKQPEAGTRNYLKVIARAPDTVRQALATEAG